LANALKEELDGIDVAVAKRVSPETTSDPVAFARALCGMMQAVEYRRAFESWRYGQDLYLQFRPLITGSDQDGTYLELRAKLHAKLRGDGRPAVRMQATDGSLRRWAGPDAPGRGERLTVDQLPHVTGVAQPVPAETE
jgi:hypothetical protein